MDSDAILAERFALFQQSPARRCESLATRRASAIDMGTSAYRAQQRFASQVLVLQAKGQPDYYAHLPLAR